MAEKDLPSNSDESDEDFVPEGHYSSDEDSGSDNAPGSDSNEENGPKSRKRRKISKRKKKKEELEEEHRVNEEKVEKVTDVDALWADFKEDTNKMEKHIMSKEEKLDSKKNTEETNEKPQESDCISLNTKKENKKKFMPRGINNSKLGLNKVLNQIGKKDKMSTLAKSQLDWNNYKKSQGIEEEIKMHNRGKDGYLEKQDFLQRTDMRQFEIEKQMRASTKRHF